MITHISAWQTIDGKIFENLKSAELHDSILAKGFKVSKLKQLIEVQRKLKRKLPSICVWRCRSNIEKEADAQQKINWNRIRINRLTRDIRLMT